MITISRLRSCRGCASFWQETLFQRRARARTNTTRPSVAWYRTMLDAALRTDSDGAKGVSPKFSLILCGLEVINLGRTTLNAWILLAAASRDFSVSPCAKPV